MNANEKDKTLRRIIAAVALIAVLLVVIIIALQSRDEGVPMAPGPLPIGSTPTSSHTVV